MEAYLLENASTYRDLVAKSALELAPKPAAAVVAAEGADEAGAGTELADTDIVITARIRPVLDDEVAGGQLPGVFQRVDDAARVEVHEMRRPVKPTAPPIFTTTPFILDKVYSPDNSTEEIYTDLVAPLVPSAWAGGVSTLFAYGQTGSGKTHTVSGLERLVAESLFSGSSELALSGSRRAYVSILELAGKAYDLLNGREPVTILEDASGATHFSGATEHEVPDAETLLSYIEDAAGFRHTEATERNGASSRSHAICKLRLVDSSRGDPEKPHASDGMFFLIDLAGSEVARDRAAHTAERMRETRDINVSLAALKACILARSTGAPYVPYRQNRLTRVLKHVFDPAAESRRCRTVVVACINPSFLDIGATKSTLRYGADLKTAPIAAPVAHVRVPFHPAKPLTWSRTELHQWISENSTVRPETLAPTETTRKLLALRPTEFIGRCQRTRGVTPLQAKELHAKFWGLHVDSLFEGDVRAINNRKGVMGSGPTAVATATGSAKPPRAPLKQRPTIPVVS